MAVVSVSETIHSVPLGEYVPTADQRVVMHGVSWDAFERLLELRGEALPRVTYLEGTLELMSPSTNHEVRRKRFVAVIEAYMNHLDIRYEGIGALLMKSSRRKAGLEPDECYLLHDTDRKRPDLAVEVVWTSGGIKKLEIYRRLGIGEVWFWIKGAIRVHVLTPRGYVPRDASLVLPDLDLALVARMMELSPLSEVHKAIATHLKATSRKPRRPRRRR